MRNAKMPFLSLGGLVLMIVVALVLTWATTTSDKTGEMLGWVSDGIGREQAGEGVRQIDWESMPDEVIAWVEVSGTGIDEPVVQADAGYSDRYLYDDVFEAGGYGTPYVDCDCSLDGAFTVVYGHHMDDGSVFADFARFSDVAYADEHRTIYLYTRCDNERHELRAVAVDVLDASCESLQTEFKNGKAFDDYVQSRFENSEVVLDRLDSISHLYAFATCSYETWNSRTVVYATEHL